MDRDAIFESIVSRREKECTPPWPRAKWDYTEWEEALLELEHKLNA